MTEKTNQNICRICLAVGGGSVWPLSVLSEEKLNIVVPGLKLTISSEFVVCSRCRGLVEDFYEWKTKFRCNFSGQNPYVCFTCSRYIEESRKRFQKGNDYLFCSILETCLPQVGQVWAESIMICETCYDYLRNVYFFNHKCLSVDQKIELYYRFKPNKGINLTEVLQFITDDSNNLSSSFNFDEGRSQSRHGQMEVNNQQRVTGSHKTDNENKKKYSPEKTDLNRATSDEPPSKRDNTNKLMINSLPSSAFFFRDNILRAAKDVTMDDWLEKVEMFKEQYGWSTEYMKERVLTRLKSLESLHGWVTDLTENMSWEDMKYTLISAFPGYKDFGSNIGRVLHMGKVPSETYACYFNRKMNMLQLIDKSDEEVFSLISDGIKDPLIKDTAVANCNTSVELLEYFRQCDETNSKDAAEQTSRKQEKSRKRSFRTKWEAEKLHGDETKGNVRPTDKEKLHPRRKLRFSDAETLSSSSSITKTAPPLQQKCRRCNSVQHLEVDCPSSSFSKTGGHHTSLIYPNVSSEKSKNEGFWRKC